MNKYKQHTLQKGFTLVEALVAITVLLLALAGPMTISARGLQSAFFAQDQTTAFYLAQEVSEIVRYARDNAILADDTLFDVIPAVCQTSNADGCGIDTRSLTFFDCSGSGGDACVLLFDTDGISNQRGLYNHTEGEETRFTRRLWIEEVVDDAEAEVTVEVSWQSGLFAGEKNVTLQSYIFNINQESD